MSGPVPLPPRGRLAATGPVDAIDRYYAPIVGSILRERLAWAALALPRRPLGRVLEIGYGSGIFQYTLAPRATHSVAVDVHAGAAGVRRRLHDDGIEAETMRADGTALPFADASFDAVAILSALEFIPDPAACLAEALRVLAPRGRIVCVRPRSIPWIDAVYRRLVGFDPEEEFHGGRQRVEEALRTLPARVRRLVRPTWLPPPIAPYELVVIEHQSPPASTDPGIT